MRGRLARRIRFAFGERSTVSPCAATTATSRRRVSRRRWRLRGHVDIELWIRSGPERPHPLAEGLEDLGQLASAKEEHHEDENEEEFGKADSTYECGDGHRWSPMGEASRSEARLHEVEDVGDVRFGEFVTVWLVDDGLHQLFLHPKQDAGLGREDRVQV